MFGVYLCVYLSDGWYVIWPHCGGVLLLVVQSGAPPLLTVAVLLQGVEHLVGQFQVHAQPVAYQHLRSKLKKKNPGVRGAQTEQQEPGGERSPN